MLFYFFTAVKASVHAFMFDKTITQREKDLIKSLKVSNIIVALPSLDEIPKKVSPKDFGS